MHKDQSSQSDEKKEMERCCLNNFFAILDMAPDEISSGESPDFIVNLQQKKIGIELTEFHSGSKRRKGSFRRSGEDAWELVQTTIMEEVNKHNELNETSGLLFFKRMKLPSESERNKFVEELMQLAIKMIISDCKEMIPGYEYPLLKEYLKKFHLEKVGCYITWEWNYNVSSVGVTETELINTITPKIDKISLYKGKDFDDIWLLIISGCRLSQSMGTRLAYQLNTFDQLRDLLKKSGYHRVFIYQTMIDEIYKWPDWERIKKISLQSMPRRI